MYPATGTDIVIVEPFAIDPKTTVCRATCTSVHRLARSRNGVAFLPGAGIPGFDGSGGTSLRNEAIAGRSIAGNGVFRGEPVIETE